MVVEGFDRYPALVIDFLEGAGDRRQIGGTLPGSPVVDVVAVKMSDFPAVLVDRGQGARRFVSHGLHIQMQAAGGMVDGGDEAAGFGAGTEKAGFDGGEGLDGKGDAMFAGQVGNFQDDFTGPGKGVFIGSAVFQVALLGAAQYHDGSTHAGGERG